MTQRPLADAARLAESEGLDPAKRLDGHLFGSTQPCFGCGPEHPIGFRLAFDRMDGGVRTEFVASERYQGPPGIMHGGLVTTLADEIAAYAVISETGLFGFTVSLEARFKKPIRVLKPIEGLGRVSRNVRRLVTVDVTLAQAGELCFEGKLKFALLDEKAAEQLLGGPLPDSWRSYARRA